MSLNPYEFLWTQATSSHGTFDTRFSPGGSGRVYHGTVGKFVAAIRKQGLLPGTRRDVHLSAKRENAVAVGARRGAPVVLIIETHLLLRDGYQFRCSENGVWLIPPGPPKYLRLADE